MNSEVCIEFYYDHSKLSDNELQDILNLDKDYFPTPWNDKSWSCVFSESRMLAVLTCDNQLVGFSLFNLSLDDQFGHLLKILIIPEFRKLGLGKRLLSESISELNLNKGIKNYFLEVESNNESAILTYGVIGFHPIHIKKDFYGNNRPALIMSLNV